MMRVQLTNRSDDSYIEIHQEAARRQRLLEGLQWLEDSGAILHGHFKFGSGRDERHGSTYVLGRRLFSIAYASKWLTQSLFDVLPAEIRQQTEFIAGPQTAGIIVARDLADFITTSRKKGEPGVEAVFFDKDKDGGYELHPSDQRRLKNRQVIIVDDVRHLGLTFAVCAQRVQEVGGSVIATAELIDRGLKVLPLRVPNFFVGQIDPDKLYTKEECPKCRIGEPITRF
jgi:orotate phosphoribosyltransferase